MARDRKVITKIHMVAFHRNGIGGAPFHAVTFRGPGSNDEPTEFVATVFDAPGHVAVIAVEPLDDPSVGVAFGQNSWRGDHFEAELREAIATHISVGSTRAGPFAIPSPDVIRGFLNGEE